MRKNGLIASSVFRKKNSLKLILIWTSVWFFGYYLIHFLIDNNQFRYSTQLYFSRITLLLFLGYLILTVRANFNKILTVFKRTAVDLAIFRVLFFGFLAIGLLVYPSAISDQIIPFVNLPKRAQVALPFMSWYPSIVPINLTLVNVFSVLFCISIFTSLFGFKTRWSILLFTISFFYLFMIPNLYGKVNHNHHIIWFSSILIFSPCADRFSVDALLQSKSKVEKRNFREYSLPIALIWILIGLIYFFPGFWKVWSNGLGWCFTDNVRNQMYYKWFQMGEIHSWVPFFRIDQYPILYKSVGFFTIIFELTFIFLVFDKRTRLIAVLSGLLFHLGTLVFMNIFFVVLVWSYFSFVKWSELVFFKESKEKSSILNSADLVRVKVVGGVLIVSCIAFGIGKWNSWPFTVYPTFDAIVEENTTYLSFTGITKQNDTIELTKKPLIDEFSSERYWEMEWDVLQNASDGKIDTTFLNRLIFVIQSESGNHYLEEVVVSIERSSIIPEERNSTSKEQFYSKSLSSD